MVNPIVRKRWSGYKNRRKKLEILKACLNDLVLLKSFMPKMKCYTV